jgi:hypothetical protein
VTAVTETNPRPSRWYYERARGSYATDINGIPAEQNKREFKELYPAAQKLDKLDLGRLENIWRLEPHVVCRGAQSSFAELMKYFGKMTLVVDAEYFKRLVAKKILLKAVDDTLKSCGVGGHRAATSCYVLAWLFKHTAHRIDLDRVWMNQAASPALRSSLKGLVDNAHEFLTTYVAGKNMLSEFAKKTFWDRFAEQQFPLQEELLGELLTDSPPLYNFERLPLGDS